MHKISRSKSVVNPDKKKCDHTKHSHPPDEYSNLLLKRSFSFWICSSDLPNCPSRVCSPTAVTFACASPLNMTVPAKSSGSFIPLSTANDSPVRIVSVHRTIIWIDDARVGRNVLTFTHDHDVIHNQFFGWNRWFFPLRITITNDWVICLSAWVAFSLRISW